MFWLEHLRLVLARFQPLRLEGTAMERGVALGCGGMRGDQRRHRAPHRGAGQGAVPLSGSRRGRRFSQNHYFINL